MGDRILKSDYVIYMLCVLCKRVGVTYYPARLHSKLTDRCYASSNVHVTGTVCSECIVEPNNCANVDYLQRNGVTTSYMKSTWIYDQITSMYNKYPSLIYGDKHTILLDMDHFTYNVTGSCSLYSIVRTDNVMVRAEPKGSFYGVPGVE